MLSRTGESAVLQGRLLGFRNFIKTAEYDRIKRMVGEDPEYYFKVMPYAMVFDMSNAWADKFANIQIERPAWYVSDMASDRMFSAMMFSEAMNTTTRSWSSQFSNSPDSGGSSGGGGFSGGGGGGGGGGAW